VIATFDHTTGVLTITGLTISGIGHGLARFVQQWVFQQAAYKNLIAPPLPGAMQAAAAKKDPT
jgi:CTP-dependent riboflavin kinase